MKNFKFFLLQEAIALSTIRAMYKKANMWMVGKYAKVWKAHKNDNPFNTTKRMYFPLVKGGSVVQQKIEQVLSAAGYTVVDYITGEVTKTGDKNKYKVGRVLNKLGQLDLVKAYQTDLNNLTKQSSKEAVKAQSGKPMMIVLCRHYVDYLQQTEGRRWMQDSCKGITNGYTNNQRYLPMEFVGGWLVAYLIDADDIDIKDPLARVLIIPFIKRGSNESRLYVASENTYGTGVAGWTDRVDEILDESGLRKSNSYGTYELDDGSERYDGYVGTLNTTREHMPSLKEIAQDLFSVYKDSYIKDNNIYITITDQHLISQYFKVYYGLTGGELIKDFFLGELVDSNIPYFMSALNFENNLYSICNIKGLVPPNGVIENESFFKKFVKNFEDDIKTSIATKPNSDYDLNLTLTNNDGKGKIVLGIDVSRKATQRLIRDVQMLKDGDLAGYLVSKKSFSTNYNNFFGANSFWYKGFDFKNVLAFLEKTLKMDTTKKKLDIKPYLNKDSAIIVQTKDEYDILITLLHEEGYGKDWSTSEAGSYWLNNNDREWAVSISFDADKHLSFLKRKSPEELVAVEQEEWGITAYVFRDMLRQAMPESPTFKFTKDMVVLVSSKAQWQEMIDSLYEQAPDTSTLNSAQGYETVIGWYDDRYDSLALVIRSEGGKFELTYLGAGGDRDRQLEYIKENLRHFDIVEWSHVSKPTATKPTRTLNLRDIGTAGTPLLIENEKEFNIVMNNFREMNRERPSDDQWSFYNTTDGSLTPVQSISIFDIPNSDDGAKPFSITWSYFSHYIYATSTNENSISVPAALEKYPYEGND